MANWQHILNRLEQDDCKTIHKLYSGTWARLTDVNGKEHYLYPGVSLANAEQVIDLVKAINEQGNQARNRRTVNL